MENNEETVDDYDDLVRSFQQEFEEPKEKTPPADTMPENTILELCTQSKETWMILQECLTDLRNRYNQILEEKEKLLSSITERKEKRMNFKPLHLFTAPYFRDVRGFHPPINQDTIEKRSQNHVTAYLTAPPPWNKQEHKTFLEIIRKNARETALKPFKLREQFLIEKVKKKYLPFDDQVRTKAEILCIHEKIQVIRVKPFEQLWEEENIKLDWLKISNDMLNKNCDRSPESCELMWENCLHPSINKKCFTEEEDRELARLAELHGEKNWNEIAKSLQTNRTALQCFERFQSTLNKKLSKKFWTSEDDQQLIETVEFCRVGGFIPWKKVLQFMNGWTSLQLQNRWDRCLKPQNRGGPWTPEEDAILLLSVPCIGHRWKMTSDFLHGRSSYICRERYTNVLDPLLHTGDWTLNEDRQLLTLLSFYGEKWGTISRGLSGRTDNMVNQRCSVLKRYKPDLYNKVLHSNGEDLQTILPKKQFARTNNCKDINTKRENIRAMAFDCAKSAVQKVRGSKCDVLECKTFKDLADKINFSTLKEISCILLPKRIEALIKRPKPSYHCLENLLKMEQETTDEDEDLFLTDAEEDEQMEELEELEEVESGDQKVFMRPEELDALDIKFNECIFPISVCGCEKAFALKNRKMEIEYHVVCTYLIKAFNLQVSKKVHTSNDSSDEEDSVFKGIDFSKTCTRFTEMFTFAMSQKQSLMFPVNVTSLKSFIVILLMRRSLRGILTTLPSEELGNLDPILGSGERSQNCSECFAIQQREKDSAVNNQGSAGIVCIECADTELIKNRLKVLIYRFFTTFCYSAFFAIFMPSAIQIQEFLMKTSGHYFNRFVRHQKRKRKSIRRLSDSDSYTDDET